MTGKLSTEERRQIASSLRDAGLSFEEIAQEMIKRFGRENLPNGYNKRICHLDVRRELDKKLSDEIQINMRRKMIFQYRKDGLSYPQIVVKLRAELGDQLPPNYSARNACRDLKRYLKKLQLGNRQEAIVSKSINRERLNELLNAVWDKARQGDDKAINLSLKIIHELSNLDSADKVAPSGSSSSNGASSTLAEIGDRVARRESKGIGNENDQER